PSPADAGQAEAPPSAAQADLDEATLHLAQLKAELEKGVSPTLLEAVRTWEARHKQAREALAKEEQVKALPSDWLFDQVEAQAGTLHGYFADNDEAAAGRTGGRRRRRAGAGAGTVHGFVAENGEEAAADERRRLRAALRKLVSAIWLTIT